MTTRHPIRFGLIALGVVPLLLAAVRPPSPSRLSGSVDAATLARPARQGAARARHEVPGGRLERLASRTRSTPAAVWPMRGRQESRAAYLASQAALLEELTAFEGRT
jgi:hypothetical protein